MEPRFDWPRMKITANDGTDMERNPRPVDFEVSRPIGETYTGKDSQLDAAVRELLKQLGTNRNSTTQGEETPPGFSRWYFDFRATTTLSGYSTHHQASAGGASIS